jgi:cell division protein FtsI (penicillin-binding protein 3)
MSLDSMAYRPKEIKLNGSTIPDVRGMGARDAVYLLEKLGLRVNVHGSGRVVAQTLVPGQRVVKGVTIGLTMR